jgi:hypothetical protein
MQEIAVTDRHAVQGDGGSAFRVALQGEAQPIAVLVKCVFSAVEVRMSRSWVVASSRSSRSASPLRSFAISVALLRRSGPTIYLMDGVGASRRRSDRPWNAAPDASLLSEGCRGWVAFNCSGHGPHLPVGEGRP